MKFLCLLLKSFRYPNTILWDKIDRSSVVCYREPPTSGHLLLNFSTRVIILLLYYNANCLVCASIDITGKWLRLSPIPEKVDSRYKSYLSEGEASYKARCTWPKTIIILTTAVNQILNLGDHRLHSDSVHSKDSVCSLNIVCVSSIGAA